MGTRCDPYLYKMLTGEDVDYCCHSNLIRAVAPYRLGERDVHDVLNVFEVDGLMEDKRYASKPSPARKGDFFEFFAEIDILCALSTCHQGDLSMAVGETGEPVCHPLGVEVYRPSGDLLDGWKRQLPSNYHGNHGMLTS